METQALQLESAESYITRSASKWLDDLFDDLKGYVQWRVCIYTHKLVGWNDVYVRQKILLIKQLNSLFIESMEYFKILQLWAKIWVQTVHVTLTIFNLYTSG